MQTAAAKLQLTARLNNNLLTKAKALINKTVLIKIQLTQQPATKAQLVAMMLTPISRID
jgi:hypothetical protein